MQRRTEPSARPRAVRPAIGAIAALLASAAALWPGAAAASPRIASAQDPVPAPVANPCHRRRAHLRCPDLLMSAPRDFEFDRSTIGGRVLLRATSALDNRGLGPIELSAHRRAHHRWRSFQAIYDRRGRRHLFATRASLVFKHVSGERYGVGYVGGASYWKLGHLAAFQLWSVGPRLRARRLVRTGPKVDYCLRDLTRTSPSSRSPAAPVYGACDEDPNLRHDVFGTSVGWTDRYPYSYPEQWIDVSALRGRFAFVQIADPRHLFHETNERNNVSETYVQLPSGRVLGHRVGVSRA
ncbi:MAG: hypothetical protein QOK19_2678 [Solirubrobacteraceae bacterium]|jgi:hypothetical protein|nr:hypothetical protein [Solirubrobacteraceae bacterium]